MGFLLALLPKQYKQMVKFAGRIIDRLDTRDEREAAMAFLLEATQADGKLTCPQWTKFGGMLGILKGPERKQVK
jgi:hypothetical protein